MTSLRGTRIALLEAQMSGQLEDLVRQHGGEPYCVPAVREKPKECGPDLDTFVDQIRPGHVVVFTSGVAAAALLYEAGKRGRLEELKTRLAAGVTVCRSANAISVLDQAGIATNCRARAPFTTAELLLALGDIDLRRKTVCVAQYGERNVALLSPLARHGVKVRELILYEWQLPADRLPLRRLVEELIERRVGAIAFTSEVQVRHLFAVAGEMRAHEELQSALQSYTLVAALGQTCVTALEAEGVSPSVVPPEPAIDQMVDSLARHLSQSQVA